jgi:hypothetical protein
MIQFVELEDHLISNVGVEMVWLKCKVSSANLHSMSDWLTFNPKRPVVNFETTAEKDELTPLVPQHYE